jgi:thiamine biosynthesis lipoprotein
MNDNKWRIWFAVFVGMCLIAAVYFIGKLPGRPVEVDGGYREIMGTFARVVAVADNTRQARACIEAGFAELRRIDSVMSDYKTDSELGKVNREAFGKAVKVSPELFWILQKSSEFSRLSNGAFDITVGPLVDLWHKAGEANAMPDENALAEAKARVGYEKLILDANAQTVQFAVEGMRLDLGGIAKGYAVDKAVVAMQRCGAIGGMVDSGGNIRCFGKPTNKDVWLVGLQNPQAVDVNSVLPQLQAVGSDQVLMVLKLNDMAVATSGGYRRFVTVDGRRFSHIIDTNTATSANKLASDTIIARTAIDADALSTAVNVLGPEKGLALIESLPDVEAILITAEPQYRVVKSDEADAYLQSHSPPRRTHDE